MPAIPVDFKPLIEGYAIGAPAGVRMVPVGGGGSRIGLEWERGKQPFQIAMRMPAEKFLIWSLFFTHRIKRGALSFTMPLDSGFGLEDHTVTMVPGSYSAQRTAGQITTVSFTVEAESAAYALTAAEADTLINAYNGSSYGLKIPRDMCPVIQGYGFDGGGGVWGSDVGGGNPRNAAMWDRDVQQFRVTLVLTAAKFEIWTLFLHHKTKNGSQTFTMPLDSGMGVEDHLVTMIPGSYTVSRNGGVSVVSFAVEAESSTYGVSAADAQAIIDLWPEYGVGLGDVFARLAKLMNEDILVLQ